MSVIKIGILFISNVTATPQFIPIDKLGLPVQPTRQFRRVDFVESLTQELLKEPCGSHGCLFVVAKGIEKKEAFDLDKKMPMNMMFWVRLIVCWLATKRLHSQYPDNRYFSGKMARIYCALTDDQAIYLGAMHQKSTSFYHDVTYREEVHFVITCRPSLETH